MEKVSEELVQVTMRYNQTWKWRTDSGKKEKDDSEQDWGTEEVPERKWT